MKQSLFNLRENATEALLGGGLGVGFSLCLLASAQVGAFGDGGRSEKFVAIWATRTLPVVTLVCAIGAIAVPGIYSRERAVQGFISRLKQRDRALGLAAEQFYEEHYDAALGQAPTYVHDEFFMQAPPPAPSPAAQMSQSYATALANEVPPMASQTANQNQAANGTHPQGGGGVQNNPHSGVSTYPYNPLA